MSTDVLADFKDKLLTLPALPHSYISLEKADDVELPVSHLQASLTQPFAATEVLQAFLSHNTTVAEGKDVKTVHDVKLIQHQDAAHHYWPGDTIGILSNNIDSDVLYILEHLNLLSQADITWKVGISTGTAKKGAKLPTFVPELISFRRLFKECLDLRAIPKKLFIRALVPCATEPQDRRFLEVLCSKEGNSAYERVVLQQGKGLISLLQLVPSCKPNTTLLIEHLPRLMPRPYSIANVYHEDTNPVVRFLFSHDKQNPGITTTFLQGLEKGATVYFCFRQSSAFTYKDSDIMRNIIMVGTGTGISPYLAFLEQRSKALAKGETVGRAELFAGFRYRERSYLCKEEIAEHLQEGSLDACHEAFSRDENTSHKYVQSHMRENKNTIINNIKHPLGLFYVCGDSKVLLPQITDTIIDILAEEPGAEDKEDIKTFVAQLKKEGKYREDVWL
ncbi:methionine synthase reductase-like [Anopheles nili]|uniref:methionine synthase reductase-like n=1 Tax=Anopheles nili TaxID=185578 RepID=UPI00237A9C79|nr:methionine synthase reductase-like [Anopheles nili]